MDNIFVIWSSADPEVAENLVFMYTLNSRLNGWWKNVRLVIWGPSARLAAENVTIRERIGELLEAGVEVWACKACSDNYGTTDELEALGVNVLYMGTPLTDMLKQGWKQLTF
ncbi:DsrE family protein [Salidesulfovibrio onnuriiensis]|uniref:DsrE family protein n=1 Tax=Salidesulfovibrio onnuriiensis TaxID=2583823 RepID=UPI0011C805D1|nr:DsrE family protein [Salidesulfovibrio onnuriiensis]